MRNFIFQKSRLFLVAGFLYVGLSSLNAQQHVIINKDNTRPETMRQVNAAHVNALTTTKHNGYNELQWSVLEKDAGNQFFIEYSFDGINFQSAGPALSNNGSYNHRHYTMDTRPVIYRVRIETAGLKPNYSNAVLLDGSEISPVDLYSTTIKGNTVNARAQFPVERVTIISRDGLHVFTKDVGGVTDFISLAIPTMKEGLYFITFYGKNWKTTKQVFYQS